MVLFEHRHQCFLCLGIRLSTPVQTQDREQIRGRIPFRLYLSAFSRTEIEKQVFFYRVFLAKTFVALVQEGYLLLFVPVSVALPVEGQCLRIDALVIDRTAVVNAQNGVDQVTSVFEDIHQEVLVVGAGYKRGAADEVIHL